MNNWHFTWTVKADEKDVVRRAIAFRFGITPSQVTKRDVEHWFRSAINADWEDCFFDYDSSQEEEEVT